MKTALTLCSLLCLIILLFPACGEDEVEMTPRTEFYNDGEFVFLFSTEGNNVTLELEALLDTINQIGGTFPDTDFYTVYADYNRNGVIDEGIDVLFSPLEDGRICRATLIRQQATAPCDFPGNVSGQSRFQTSEAAATDHVTHTLTLPKDQLTAGDTASLVINMYAPETNSQRLPSNDTLFVNTLEISW
ncbi:MAG: hypothetical protein AAGJ82_07305 [Bacteroidota bacterium]